MRRRMRHAGWGLGTALILAVAMSLQAAEQPAGDLIIVSKCENIESWSTRGELAISTQPDDRREGNAVLCLSYSGKGWGHASIRLPEVAITTTHVFSFRMRGASPDANARFWVYLMCDNGASFRKELGLATLEWFEIFLLPRDFVRLSNRAGEPPDWTKIRSVRLSVDDAAPQEEGNILVDDIAFRKAMPAGPEAQAPLGDLIMINNCDDTDSWTAAGKLAISVQTGHAQEGKGCLSLSYEGRSAGSATTPVEAVALSPSHVLTFSLRGASADTGARLSIELTSDDGNSFQKELDIANADWSQVLLVPADFQATEGANQKLDWASIRSMTLQVENAGTGRGDILLDAISFHKLQVTGPRDPKEDEFYWWWDGGWDSFLARHVSSADWAHREDQPQHDAPMKFDRFILSPYVPYTVYLHNDKAYERLMLTITDWRLNPIKIVNLTRPGAGITQIKLAAPAKAGTYLFNLERYEKGSDIPQHYQTGVMVLAKRLNEPTGIWGFFAYMMHSQMHDRFDLVLDMFQAIGAMGLREQVKMPSRKPADYHQEWDVRLRRAYYEALRARGIVNLALIEVRRHPEVISSIRRGKPVSPEALDRFLADVETTARSYKGLVDWYELGNELNKGGATIPPYAELLKKSNAAAKRGDPDCKLIMCGSGRGREWQKNLWELEKAETDPQYKTYQDAITTHLYPDLQGVEFTLRQWLYGREGSQSMGRNTLRAKGHLMTEAAWPLKPKLQALLRHGLAPRDYSGDLDYQCWMGMYSSVMLGEHLKMGATLHGVYFFRALTELKRNYIYDPPVPAEENYVEGELAVASEGYFMVPTGAGSAGWVATVARPIVYTHNTIARLLTHEVQRASVEIDWDHDQGNVESYAFRRPGETVVAAWMGPPERKGIYYHWGWQQMLRPDELAITVKAPTGAALALVVDLDGNESAVPIVNGVVQLRLTRPPDVRDEAGQLLWLRGPQPTFLRFLEGDRIGDVFFQNLKHIPDGQVRLMKGTPESNGELVEGVSADRNLPAIGEMLPAPGAPMVLYSKRNEILYIVGRTVADVSAAEKALKKLK